VADVKAEIIKRLKDKESLAAEQGPGVLTINDEHKLAPITADPARPVNPLREKIMGSLRAGKIPDLNPVEPGDETTVAPNNLRNLAVEKFGLPENWKISTADEKRYLAGAPEMIAGATMGSIAKTGGGLLKGAAATEAKGAEKLFELGHTRAGAGLEGQAVFNKGTQNVGKVLNPQMESMAGKNVNVGPQKFNSQIKFDQVKGADVQAVLDRPGVREALKESKASKLANEGIDSYEGHKKALVDFVKRRLGSGDDVDAAHQALLETMKRK